MKKTIIGVVITIPLVIVTLIVGLLVYVSVSRNAIKDNYFNYIESLGYASEDTQIMEVEHSFVNKAFNDGENI